MMGKDDRGMRYLVVLGVVLWNEVLQSRIIGLWDNPISQDYGCDIGRKFEFLFVNICFDFVSLEEMDVKENKILRKRVFIEKITDHIFPNCWVSHCVLKGGCSVGGSGGGKKRSTRKNTSSWFGSPCGMVSFLSGISTFTTRRFFGHTKDVVLSVACLIDNYRTAPAWREISIRLWNSLGEYIWKLKLYVHVRYLT
ncbi:hypothetical protein C5167_032762 [Papaver somniferum]|uniref:Uncharacterized protein n=1 Tax=Papaver somniferum TaxID=3469 RepID=A0A4Y7K8E7_PAPSO|nr:hypothetical protein C5167_032762 [Papaver somniferum]